MNTQFKLLVAGSRSITDDTVINAWLDQVLENHPNLCIISGGAKGVDSIAAQWAQDHNVTLQVIKADWKRYGKSAGFKRNEELIKTEPHGVVAFCPDAQPTKGTGHTLGLATAKNIPTRYVQIKGETNE